MMTAKTNNRDVQKSLWIMSNGNAVDYKNLFSKWTGMEKKKKNKKEDITTKDDGENVPNWGCVVMG